MVLVVFDNVLDCTCFAELRVNGSLPNLQAFYDVFGCGKDGAMYLAPEKRAMVWNLK